MTFIDEMKIHIKAGDGGNGVVRWLHEYAKEFGGPSGGDGGHGGDVYIRAVEDTFYLRKYANTHEFVAKDGEFGSGNSCQGKSGEDLYIDLPVGTVITRIEDINIHDSETIVNPQVELSEVGQTFRILKGGSGGYGNEHFKASTNIKPEECVAFGDYLNDYEMMQSVYYSYAMENAIPELKKVARYIAPPNYKNGVVKTIRQLLAQQESNH